MALTREAKIAKQFGLTLNEAGVLVAAGFDTPHKIEEADAEELPDGFSEKLARFLQSG